MGGDLRPYAEAASEFLRAVQGRVRATGGAPPLEPDSQWVDSYELPPSTLFEERVSAWLRSVGADPDESTDLAPVETARESNRVALLDLTRRARTVVSAWCRKNGAAPPAWRTSSDELVLRATQAGALDFREMSDGALIGWLDALGEWPKCMLQTADAGTLGLTPSDIQEEEQGQRQERAVAERERRTVILDGRRVGLEAEEVAELVGLVRAGITPAFLATTDTPAALGTLRQAAKHSARTTPHGGSRTRQLPEPKREVIGFIGELVSYHWLAERFGATPSSWRSRNRRFLFADDEGDDSLGYDFEIPKRRGRHLFEVKATSDAEGSKFDLTEAEIRAAQEHASSYRVLFVRNVLNSALRTIHLLPNPLHPRWRSYYRMEGNGITYSFRIVEGK